jgi:hypothetical protein
MAFDTVVDSLQAALAAVPEGAAESTGDDDRVIFIALLGVTSPETPVTLWVNALIGLAAVLQVLAVVLWAPRSCGLRAGAGVTCAVGQRTTC